MSLKQTTLVALAMIMSYAGGVVTAQLPERFELTGNMKVFGAGNGIIFPDGTKQTSAGVGTSTDVTCPTTCVGAGEIAAGAVGTSEVADNTLTADDLAPDSVGSSEIAAAAVGTSEVADNTLTSDDLAPDSVGSSEIGVAAVGTSEVADNTLTADDLASDSVFSSEIAAAAVGTSEVSNNSLTSDDLAPDSVGSSEIAAAAVGASEVADRSIRLTELNGNVVMNYTLDLAGVINNGSCSNFSGQGGLTNIAANSFVIIFGVRPVGSNTNPGWVIEGEDNPTQIANQIDVRVCNNTGQNLDPPNLRFNFFAIAP